MPLAKSKLIFDDDAIDNRGGKATHATPPPAFLDCCTGDQQAGLCVEKPPMAVNSPTIVYALVVLGPVSPAARKGH